MLPRTIATFTFVVSAGVVLGMLPAKYFIFHPFYLIRFPPQIWRLATSFLVTSPGIGLLFDTYFLYTYLCQLEVGNPRFPRKEDLIWYLLFVCGTILVSDFIHEVSRLVLVHSFLLAWTRCPCCVSPPSKEHASPHILPGQCYAPTSVTVPRNEEDNPCISVSPSFAKRTVLRCRHGGMSYGWLV